MEIRCEYTSEEVEQMVLEVHGKNFTLPEEMEWAAISRTYGGVKVEAIQKRDKQQAASEQQAEIPAQPCEEVQPL